RKCNLFCEVNILVHNGKKTCSGKIPEPKKDENLILDLLGYYDAKQVITDIARGEVDLDTLKAGASLIPVAKITKVPKVVKAIGNVRKTGFKKGKEGDKTVWKRFTREDKPKPDKNKGNQSKAGSKSGTTTSKPNQEEVSKSGQAKQTKVRDRGESGNRAIPYRTNGRNGKQTRLKEIAKDPKVSSALRGEIKRDINEIKRGKRKN